MAETAQGRVIGFMVCGPGEADRYLDATLKEFKRLADDAVIVGNNTDPKTEALIESYGFWFYRDDREWGRFQPAIKTDLLARVARLDPEWILALDADEQFATSFTRRELDLLIAHRALAFYFYIVNLWNEEKRYWKQGSFWNIRLYRYAPEYGIQFAKKNVHCGLAPPYAYRFGRHAPYIVRHYGLLKESDRKTKAERYKKYDPRGEKIGIGAYYEAIAASGEGDLFDEEALQKKVVAEVEKMRQDYNKTFDTMANIKKFVYVRRMKDGAILDIPADHLEAHLKRGFQFVAEINYDSDKRRVDVPIVDEPREDEAKTDAVGEKSPQFSCPLCGFRAIDKDELMKHKAAQHAPKA